MIAYTDRPVMPQEGRDSVHRQFIPQESCDSVHR